MSWSTSPGCTRRAGGAHERRDRVALGNASTPAHPPRPIRILTRAKLADVPSYRTPTIFARVEVPMGRRPQAGIPAADPHPDARKAR